MTVRPVPGGVLAPKGFRGAGVSAGIKASGALDLALILADEDASAAAVFTTNQVQAAPVVVSRDHLTRAQGRIRAVVVNSGCANACTGEAGLAVARQSAEAVAERVGCRAEQVLVASTGVIGVDLPLQKVKTGIDRAMGVLSRDGDPVAQAIMTTDLSPKQSALSVASPTGTFTVGGIAKGAGMIEPMMATMLGFITTDAAVAPAVLQRALVRAVEPTFNSITVDGECSTNDTVIAMASGSSGVSISDDAEVETLVAALTAVCNELALMIVRGGEGATKLVAVRVTGAASTADARRAARTIANSPLVKTAVHGADPNWGRLVAATGRSGVPFALDRALVEIGSVVLFENGQPHDAAAPQAAEHLRQTDVRIHVDLGTGGGHEATIWTCDLSAEYVRINGEYRT